MDKEAALLQELHGLRLDAPGLAENALALGRADVLQRAIDQGHQRG